jgi:hypothetical protein
MSLLCDRDGDGVAWGVLARTIFGDIVEHLPSDCVVFGMTSFDPCSEKKGIQAHVQSKQDAKQVKRVKEKRFLEDQPAGVTH